MGMTKTSTVSGLGDAYCSLRSRLYRDRDHNDHNRDDHKDHNRDDHNDHNRDDHNDHNDDGDDHDGKVVLLSLLMMTRQ